MDTVPTYWLCLLLAFLITVSGFFSSSETGMMASNRYKLRHLAQKKHRTAARVLRLLARPDRLLGVILIGNTLANNLASIVALLIAKRVLGDTATAMSLAVLGVTFLLLVFSEMGPKTVAATYPQGTAFLAVWPLQFLLRLLYPIVWFTSGTANAILWLLGVRLGRGAVDSLNADELRSIINETRGKISADRQAMLLGLLDLEKATVEDIMIPRQEVVGINLDDDWDTILNQLRTSSFAYLPLYYGDIEQVVGMLYLRDALHLFTHEDESCDKHQLEAVMREAYFIPEGTPLTTQLMQFRNARSRIGLVVDEYGDIQGLVALEDILEEIVGEFTTDPATLIKGIYPQPDGSVLVDGGESLRELNRSMDWTFPTDGPKTLSGLIIEHLETMPRSRSSVLLSHYPIEIVRVKDNMVKTARINPRLQPAAPAQESD